jgi:hypothetical protein
MQSSSFCFQICNLYDHTTVNTGKWSLKDRLKVNVHQDEELELGIEGSNSVFRLFSFSQVLEATKNFSVENKLGQGGFGPVYKVG